MSGVLIVDITLRVMKFPHAEREAYGGLGIEFRARPRAETLKIIGYNFSKYQSFAK